MKSNFLILTSTDNVATAISDLKAGEVLIVDGKEIKLRDEIKLGHKFSVKQIKKGDFILKYGEIIGAASYDIYPGEHVHVHNIHSLRGGSSGRH